MNEDARQHKAAWEFDAYDFWVRHAGTPRERAAEDRADPLRMLRKYAAYFDRYEGVRIANICGSCGKKAIPLALLGAEVTVFDISEDNRRYALETAEAAGTHIDFVLGDVMEIDLAVYGGRFDVVFMEGGVLHYFHDPDAFMRLMYALLAPGGRMICSDFHPFTKISDTLHLETPSMSYFSREVFEGEMAHARFYEEEVRRRIPKCRYRKYTVSEIINAVIGAGFTLLRFDEHPSWENESLPGEFTAVAVRPAAAEPAKYRSLLASTSNTRDLGGHRTRSGGITRRDRIWRSDAPVTENEADADLLRDLGITTVIDLRTDAEAARKPCVYADREGFAYRRIPFTIGSAPPASLEEIPGLYLEMASQPEAADVLRAVAEAEGGVLYCCTAGKDRTGVISALILTACGADPKAVVDDYAVSREYNRARLERWLAEHPGVDRRIVLADEASMERFLELFRERFGSIEAFFARSGLTGDHLAAIRRKLMG